MIFREVIGQFFQPFADSADGGRDGAFYGEWRSHPGAMSEIPSGAGAFVIQCKHTNRDSTVTAAGLRDEFAKVPRLVQANLCETYILVSNARLSGNAEEAIVSRLRKLGVKYPLVLGGRWLNQTIAANPRLRMLVPRIYGLGDLSQIIDERAYAQSRAFLNYLSDDLSTFVTTRGYYRAAESLSAENFVLLLGEPAVGKSAIAAALAVAAIDNWGCNVVLAGSAIEAVDHWNPHEPNQFFWIDDAFGSVRHERGMTDEWCRRLPKIMAAASMGAKFVLTSRDYIYKEARRYLKEYSYPRFREGKVVVSVEDLDYVSRQQILYNHLRMGDQPTRFLSWIKPHLEVAASVEPFRPEAARRLGSSRFTQGLCITRRRVQEFMADPGSFLRDVYAGMERSHIGALALVYMAVNLPSPIYLSDFQSAALTRIGCSSASALQSLSQLEGTFLRYGSSDSDGGADCWSFRHPTLREGFAALMAEDPTMLDLFIEGIQDGSGLSRLDALNGKSVGTLVRIPPKLYPRLSEILCQIRPNTQDYRSWSQYCRFLAYRCSDGFLTLHMARDWSLVEVLLKIRPILALSPEVDVLARLRTAGILDEHTRHRALKEIKRITEEFPDGSWFDSPDFRLLMDPGELMAISLSARRSIIPRLGEILRDWSDRAPQDGDATSHYRPLCESFYAFQELMRSDDSAVWELEKALRAIDEISRPERFKNQQLLTQSGVLHSPNEEDLHPGSVASRSTFDDL
ncbi:hypothetical protein [Kitasatospora sp. NBC_01300]|uniref:nSTAND3 domain-containing NTPase n=1 Tax=Kitasatospora sp. NBC_01300 TaxID=2903574 RepID=UPI00352DA306|nr:hypothetical protein OG556_19680 [Kitasatospora sp. NBC_01300]